MPATSPYRLDDRPEPKTGLVVQPVGGEHVVYDPAADLLHRLEPTATTVWTRLDGARSVSAVADEIASVYRADRDVVRADVVTLVDVLHERGLLAGSATVHRDSGEHPRRSGDAIHRQPFGTDADPYPVPGSGHGSLPPAGLVTRSYCALQHGFDIATNDAAIRTYLSEILADLADTTGAVATRYELIVAADDRYVVKSDAEVVVTTGRLDRAVAALLWRINADAISRASPAQPVVHAAAAVANGATVLLPAAPGAGKTTTVAGLIGSGFGYLTDEAVALDPASAMPGRYPKPLSIGPGSWDVLAHLRPDHSAVAGQWQVPATSIRPDAIAEPAAIRYVVEPAYDPEATTTLEPVPDAAMVVRLADSTFGFPGAPERNLRVLADVVAHADCYRMPVSDLSRAVDLITELFAR